jgi:2-polyprenyl-3-methyl-5-hydroxy-6-metoxy-1,4-benzoquinol methylase
VQPELIFNIHWGAAGAIALATAVELDLFSAIHENQTTVEKLSRHLNLPLRTLRILLDSLVGLGFLHKSKISYKLNPEAKTYLVKSEPRYLGGVLTRIHKNFEAWKSLKEIVKAGKPLVVVDESTRNQFFIELARDIFPTSYASSVIMAKKLGAGKTLKGMKILDVACGSAAWSLPFAIADRSSQVTASDLPEVIEVARQYVKRFRLESQYNFAPGDLLHQDLGRGKYDLILLGHVCHGMGELESRRLIKKCFDALNPGGRLLIGEIVPNDLRTGEAVPLLFGIEMAVHTPHGDVFTAKEFKRWLNLAGFKKVGTYKALYPTTVIVGQK